MTIRALLPLAIASTLAFSAPVAFADNAKHGRVIIIDQHGSDRHDRRHDRRDDRRDRREERVERRHDRHDRHSRHDRHDRRYDGHRHYAGPRYYYHARGPEFVRGRHLPPGLRNHQYVVLNPRHHHLSPPPRGHHWVQVGGDYVLVAIATGIIANIILNH
ncbi:MAG: RcnB family protein [Burkholderiaceae bacterium]